MKSFADGKYILVGGDSGQVIILRTEPSSNNISLVKIFTSKDSSNPMDGSIKDIVQVEYAKKDNKNGMAMYFALCTNSGLRFLSMTEDPKNSVICTL